MQINERTFVVTGTARGLGLAIAAELIHRGGKVAFVDLDGEATESSRLRADPGGQASHAYAADISNEREVRALFSAIEANLGPISGLVNNAGILRDGLLVKTKDGNIVSTMSLEQWQSVIDVNLTGVFLCGREAAAQMIRNKINGVIINISSISRAGNAGQSNYAAAKAGVSALTATWAKELARHGIRVADIAPGIFATDMVKQMPEAMLERLEQQIPLRRSGELAEIADSVCYLIGNDYFTGRTLEVDGGLRM
jgi:3-oxoacyl-[acyl-carrier protein] reductase